MDKLETSEGQGQIAFEAVASLIPISKLKLIAKISRYFKKFRRMPDLDSEGNILAKNLDEVKDVAESLPTTPSAKNLTPNRQSVDDVGEKLDNAPIKTGKVFDSFDAFREGREFADLDEARKAWDVYQRTSKSNGLILGELTETYKHATDGWDVLNTLNWSPEVNRAWLDGAIDAGRPIRLVGDASKIGSLGNPSNAMNMTRWEIGYILSRGYELRNGMFVPK
jgi:hypothetical protein